MDEKKVREAIAKEKETIKTLEDAVVSGKTGSLRRWAKDTIENSTIIIEALEKQLPKKPNLEGDGYAPNGTFVYDTWICPSCEGYYEVDYDDYVYCPQCGQKLDWSEDRKVKE